MMTTIVTATGGPGYIPQEREPIPPRAEGATAPSEVTLAGLCLSYRAATLFVLLFPVPERRSWSD